MKKRADILLVEKGLIQSREKAKRLIMAGQVRCGESVVKNPSSVYGEEAEFTVEGECTFVSRGGLKLDKAVREFDIDLKGKVCADIGASTGGFTDCMLQNGAAFVYAIDVGYGQFDWGLRNHGRVKLMERTNARYLTAEAFDKTLEFASIDVSFISLRLIIPVLRAVNAAEGHEIAALIKPQFEAGKDKVGKKGVVRELATHEEVALLISDFCAEHGYGIKGFTFSPVKGPNGNIEYLIYIKDGGKNTVSREEIKKIVINSHVCL